MRFDEKTDDTRSRLIIIITDYLYDDGGGDCDYSDENDYITIFTIILRL